MEVKRLNIYIMVTILFISCKEEKVQDLNLNTTDEYISTREGIRIHKWEDFAGEENSNSYKLLNFSDTLRFSLSEKEKEIINKSFKKHRIYSFEDHEKEVIGEIVNTLTMPKEIKIKTNKRNISVIYMYYFSSEEKYIDKEKTKRFNDFMKTVDSIIYYKIYQNKIKK